jgi:Membrane-associated phospholipid phosphatase
MMQKVYRLLFCFQLIGLQVYCQSLDVKLLKQLHADRNESWDGTMQILSVTEYAVGILSTGLVCGISLKDENISLMEKGVTIGLSIIGNSMATYVLKKSINRDRPVVHHSFVNPYEGNLRYSFPSGHTSNAFCTATALSIHFPKWYVIAPVFVWAGAVGYSRIHLGVHYPSDVVGGAVVGVSSAIATYYANRWFKKRFYEKHLNRIQEKFGFQ